MKSDQVKSEARKKIVDRAFPDWRPKSGNTALDSAGYEKHEL
jgi:hypothetical protein